MRRRAVPFLLLLLTSFGCGAAALQERSGGTASFESGKAAYDRRDWIQAQLERYGCADVERMPYRYAAEPFVDPPLGMAGGMPRAIGGGRPRGARVPMRANTDPLRQPDVALRALNSEPT